MIDVDRIVPKNLVNDLKLEQFQVGFVEAKHANKVIQVLKGLETLPEDSFFLKRVRKNKQSVNHHTCVEVLLCLTQHKDQFLQKIMASFKQTFAEDILKQVATMELPRYAPPSKKSFQEWAKYWPCNFIEPQFMKKIPHSASEESVIWQIYKGGSEKKQSHNSFYLFSESKYLANFEGLKKEFCCKNENPLEHPVMKIAQKWPESQVYKDSEKEYYYFTGLRMMVISQKLCGMCAMALVHSRIQRVYFNETSVPKEEILEILYNINLNHKIDILKVTEHQNSKQKH